MKGINRLWVGLGASVAVVGVVAGVTLGITTLLGVTFEESEPRPVEGLQADGARTGEPKPVQSGQAGQYSLSICVQAIGVDTAIQAVAKANTEAALLQVMQNPLWYVSGLGAAPLIDIGCPEGPLPARPGIVWTDAQISGGTGTMYAVPEPGPYNKYIFIMPLERIDELLGGLSIRHAPQEYVIESPDLALERASAMYITPEELQDLPFLVKHLTIAAGLEDRYPEPSPE